MLKLEREVAGRMRVLVLDVDGVLTDARIVLGASGEETMAFSARDGIGIKMAQHAGMEVVFLSARSPSIVRERARMLGVKDVRLGFERKLPVLLEIATDYGVELGEIVYVGDDLVDLEPVGAAGIGIAVGDACSDLKDAASHVTDARGGGGAVREVVEAILRARGTWDETVRGYFENAKQ